MSQQYLTFLNLTSLPLILSNSPTASNWAFQSSSFWNPSLYRIGCFLSCQNSGRDIAFCSDSSIVIKKSSFKKWIITKVNSTFVEKTFYLFCNLCEAPPVILCCESYSLLKKSVWFFFLFLISFQPCTYQFWLGNFAFCHFSKLISFLFPWELYLRNHHQLIFGFFILILALVIWVENFLLLFLLGFLFFIE